MRQRIDTAERAPAPGRGSEPEVGVADRRLSWRGLGEDRGTGPDLPNYRRAGSREAVVIRVVVVKDHDVIREALSAAQQTEPDIEVVACCPDGQAAIENLDHASPDVVVTDLSLPRVDGVAVTAHLCRHRRGVRVVMFTSAPHGHRTAAARAAGAHTVLGKSSDPSAVVAAVRATAGGLVRRGSTSTRRLER